VILAGTLNDDCGVEYLRESITMVRGLPQDRLLADLPFVQTTTSAGLFHLSLFPVFSQAPPRQQMLSIKAGYGLPVISDLHEESTEARSRDGGRVCRGHGLQSPERSFKSIDRPPDHSQAERRTTRPQQFPSNHTATHPNPESRWFPRRSSSYACLIACKRARWSISISIILLS